MSKGIAADDGGDSASAPAARKYPQGIILPAHDAYSFSGHGGQGYGSSPVYVNPPHYPIRQQYRPRQQSSNLLWLLFLLKPGFLDGIFNKDKPKPKPTKKPFNTAGWFESENNNCFYKVMTDTASFSNAKRLCTTYFNYGAQLATVGIVDEDVFSELTDADEPPDLNNVWVGLQYTAVDETWYWIDDETPYDAEVTPWAADKPDDLANAQCAKTDGETAALVNVPCGISHAYLCEYCPEH